MALTFADVMARATPKQDTVSLCLAGHLVADLHDLQRQLAAAPKVGASLAERSPSVALTEQIETLLEQMRASTVVFRLQRIHPKEWAPFYATMPVGKADDPTFIDEWFAWTADLVARTCIEPVMTVDEVGQLVDTLNEAEWTELSDAAWRLNTGKVSVPFFAAASDQTQASEPS
jgi:hypothetical protein